MAAVGWHTPGQCSRLLVAGRAAQWVGWRLGRHQHWRSHAACLRWFVGWLSEPLRLAAARAAVRSGMTGLCHSSRLVGQLVGCVVAATAGREQPEVVVMKEWAALDTVAGLAGFALPDYMHHSHNPAYRVTPPG